MIFQKSASFTDVSKNLEWIKKSINKNHFKLIIIQSTVSVKLVDKYRIFNFHLKKRKEKKSY